MAAYPKCQHLKVSMICCSIIGIFPSQFMFQENKNLQKVYAMYSWLMLVYYILFIISEYVELVILLCSNESDMLDISKNICVTIIYTISLTKQIIMRLNISFNAIIKQIIDTEKSASPIDDNEIHKIEKQNFKESNQISIWYIYSVIIGSILYVATPLMMEPVMISNGNTTQLIRYFPLSSWLPFDKQEYYTAAYLWQVVVASVGSSYIIYTDVLMFNLILFPAGQLRKLRHYLKNFGLYKQTFKILCNIADDHMAAKITFVHFIEKHKEIIEYVKRFNDTLSAVMVIDFLQSSLQIASILNQFSAQEITIMSVISVASFFACMIYRLVLYYYYANEVMLLSATLPYSIYQSNWYEQPPVVKKMILMFAMRAQKPLEFRIGAFGVMSIQSFIAILKASYSYLMLMIQ